VTRRPAHSSHRLISGFDPGSSFACMSALPLAKLSLSNPQRPLGSAGVTAIPAIIALSKRSFHSSGVKVDLSVICAAPLLFPCLLCGHAAASITLQLDQIPSRPSDRSVKSCHIAGFAVLKYFPARSSDRTSLSHTQWMRIDLSKGHGFRPPEYQPVEPALTGAPHLLAPL
jgi:hypothetical protein